jgi:hypothetical protein
MSFLMIMADPEWVTPFGWIAAYVMYFWVIYLVLFLKMCFVQQRDVYFCLLSNTPTYFMRWLNLLAFHAPVYYTRIILLIC